MARKQATHFPAETLWRRDNMSRLLFSAAWLFDSRIHAYVNANGFPDLRMVHLHVPRNLDLQGTRATDLAIRAEMSKQAMAEIIDECQRMGLVRRIPDPSDRRAKRVAFTAKGLRLMKVVRAALAAAEDEMARHVGARRMREVATALSGYLDQDARGAEAFQPRKRSVGATSRSR